jgi:hypothetical protein
MSKTEISWSLMHPTPLDVDYMHKVVSQSKNYPVDSFEICAECHSPFGGMDGLVLYEEYPAVNASLDREKILSNRLRLKEILAMAHEVGKPVYYWHREVTVWETFLDAIPQLRDANGEFDLLGEAFTDLLKYKICKTFEAVPELDGLVLTLTEADFSAIHNSTPEIYPPVKVVEHVTTIFARELGLRGKRFILRSFGSIAQDYEDILAGAALAAKNCSFEIETKITPYDFNPFLPENPFLRKITGLTLSAECDSVGEFLGAGYMPAENVDNIVRYVRYAQQCGVDRFVIRLDRVGNDIFSTYPINLFAYMQAITEPHLNTEAIVQKYAQLSYPDECAADLVSLGADGCEMVKKLYYIDGHVIFHQFPPHADFKWLKAGGIFAVFTDNVSLGQLDGIWSILSDRMTPGRAAILAEKEQAKSLAKAGLATVRRLKSCLPEKDAVRLERLWSNADVAATAILAFVRCIAAYFDDMEARRQEPSQLRKAVADADNDLIPLLIDKNFRQESAAFFNGLGHDIFKLSGDDLDTVYLKPLLNLCHMLLDEYAAELPARLEWENKSGLIDLIIPGAITDDWRCGRYMHASHTAVINGQPTRIVGNQVFPNGFVKLQLKGSETPFSLVIKGTNGPFLFEQDGIIETGEFNSAGICEFRISPCRTLNAVIRKKYSNYPQIQSVVTLNKAN